MYVLLFKIFLTNIIIHYHDMEQMKIKIEVVWKILNQERNLNRNVFTVIFVFNQSLQGYQDKL